MHFSCLELCPNRQQCSWRHSESLLSSPAAGFCVWQKKKGTKKNSMPKCDLWFHIFVFMQHYPSFLHRLLFQWTYGRSESCGWGRAPETSSATQRRLVNWTPPTASSSSMGWSFASAPSVWLVSMFLLLSKLLQHSGSKVKRHPYFSFVWSMYWMYWKLNDYILLCEFKYF